MSSHATRTSEHFLKERETKQHRDQEPFRISMKVLKRKDRRTESVLVDIFLNLQDYTALLLTISVSV